MHAGGHREQNSGNQPALRNARAATNPRDENRFGRPRGDKRRAVESDSEGDSGDCGAHGVEKERDLPAPP